MPKFIYFILFLCISPSSFAINFIAFGDSITQGFQRDSNRRIYACPNPLNGGRNNCGYGNELEAIFAQKQISTRVYNWGIGGERTCNHSSSGLARIDSVLNRQSNANVLLLMEGANDYSAGISGSTTAACLGSMIDKAKRRDLKVIVATITPNTVDGGFRNNRIVKDYNPKIRTLAIQKGVALADQYEAVAYAWKRRDSNGEGPFNSGDQLHISDKGYQRIAETWFDSYSGSSTNGANIIPILNLLLLN